MAHSLRAFTSRRTINVGEEREEHTGGRATPSSDVEFASGQVDAPRRTRQSAYGHISLRAGGRAILQQPTGLRGRSAWGLLEELDIGVEERAWARDPCAQLVVCARQSHHGQAEGFACSSLLGTFGADGSWR